MYSPLLAWSDGLAGLYYCSAPVIRTTGADSYQRCVWSSPKGSLLTCRPLAEMNSIADKPQGITMRSAKKEIGVCSARGSQQKIAQLVNGWRIAGLSPPCDIGSILLRKSFAQALRTEMTPS